MLSVNTYPATQGASRPTLMIVHGLFGFARNWGAIARHLSDQRKIIVPDLRNHGESPWTETHSYPDLAADLAALIEAEGGPIDVLGHSMGGKAVMTLALTRPELIRRLIVADIAPYAYSHDQLPNIRAMKGLDLTDLTTRAEADRRLQATVPDASMRAFFLQSLDLNADPPRWRLNLDVLATEMEKIVGWPGTTGQFPGRTLFVSGGESHYVRPEHRAAILALFPAARFVKIPGAGHWLHAEKPREFAETVRVFLAS